MATPRSMPSNLQRRVLVPVLVPSIPDKTIDSQPLHPKPNKRRKRGKDRTLRLPNENVLQSVGMTLGVLLLVAASFLIHLLFLSRQNLLANFQRHGISKTTNTNIWNPELQFSKKVYRSKRLASPIMVVGLPKAGTSTLFAYFDCLGFYSQHWYCCGPQRYAQQDNMPSYMADCMISNLQDQLPILDGCGDYDVYTELNGPRRHTKADQDMIGADGSLGYRPRIFLPQHYHLQELHAYAPNATWILNVRPVQDWIQSVQHVPANMLAKQLLFEAREQDPHRWIPPHHHHHHHHVWINNNNNQPYRPNATFLEEFWQEHLDRVTSFVQQHPSHRLILVNITHPEAGLQLAKDLSQTGQIVFPILEKRKRQFKNHSAWNTTTDTAAAAAAAAAATSTNILYSRAKACWGAHNVKQHG